MATGAKYDTNSDARFVKLVVAPEEKLSFLVVRNKIMALMKK